MKFKVISFDMFQTLVDVNARKYAVWEDILGESYTKEKAEELWQETLIKYYEYANDRDNSKANFKTMYHKFSSCYKKLFQEKNIAIDIVDAVNILFREHGRAHIYQDAKDFFTQVGSEYRIWISSDTDFKMIQPLLHLFKYEYVFISEKIGAYKQDEQGLFFRHILAKTGCKPEDIIHVGDGLSDIIGAKRAGIAACWLNRGKNEWGYNIRPDYTIQSLMELKNIL